MYIYTNILKIIKNNKDIIIIMNCIKIFFPFNCVKKKNWLITEIPNRKKKIGGKRNSI